MLQAHPELSALFYFNDQMAVGALHQAKLSGVVVPASLSVVGFDDNELAVFADPALTTVAQPLDLLGRRAIALAQQMIAEEPLHAQPLLLPELVIRGSTSVPKA